jgi:hypothetical protein
MTEKTAHEIEAQIRELASQHQIALTMQWEKQAADIAAYGAGTYDNEDPYLDFCYEELLKVAVREIIANNSGYSGGYSVTNACQQQRRETAGYMLAEIENRGVFGGPLSKAIRAAWKAAHADEKDNDTIIEESF